MYSADDEEDYNYQSDTEATYARGHLKGNRNN